MPGITNLRFQFGCKKLRLRGFFGGHCLGFFVLCAVVLELSQALLLAGIQCKEFLLPGRGVPGLLAGVNTACEGQLRRTRAWLNARHILTSFLHLGLGSCQLFA